MTVTVLHSVHPKQRISLNICDNYIIRYWLFGTIKTLQCKIFTEKFKNCSVWLNTCTQNLLLTIHWKEKIHSFHVYFFLMWKNYMWGRDNRQKPVPTTSLKIIFIPGIHSILWNVVMSHKAVSGNVRIIETL